MKDSKKQRAVYLIPNLLTTGNLFSGLAAIVAVFNEKYEAAAIAIFIAMIFDTLDGTSARFMKGTSQFGVEYDSLADLVSFGVAPGLMIYAWALHSPGMLGAAVMFAFVVCGALRLARYNVSSTGNESKAFTGLPIPAAAGVVASLVIFEGHVVGMGPEIRPIVGLVLSLVLAFLMVSTLKYRSFKDLKFRGSHHFNYLVWAILMLMLVIAWPQLMLFVVWAGYAAWGILERGLTLIAKAFGKGNVPGSSSQTLPGSQE